MTDRSVTQRDRMETHDMDTSDIGFYVKSGGRRISLYAQLGSYFRADGSINEPAFRQFVHQSLSKRLANSNADTEDAGKWLSGYLEDVLAYLDDKGLHGASLQLFELAVDESATLNVSQIVIAPHTLQRVLAMASNKTDLKAPRKNGPDEKKRRIFEVALKIFTERGFHNITMDEIAAASGVAKGTVYRYFTSKEDLLDQLLMTTSQKVVERFSTTFTGERDILEEIQEFVKEWLLFIEENHDLYRLIQAEGIIPHSGRRPMFYEYLMSNFPMVKERIVAMNASGELKMISFSTVAYGMLGFIDGVVNKWFRAGMSYPLRDETPAILEVLFNGFAKSNIRTRTFYVPPEEIAVKE